MEEKELDRNGRKRERKRDQSECRDNVTDNNQPYLSFAIL